MSETVRIMSTRMVTFTTTTTTTTMSTALSTFPTGVLSRRSRPGAPMRGTCDTMVLSAATTMSPTIPTEKDRRA